MAQVGTEHQKRAHRGAFLVFETKGKGEGTYQTQKTCPSRACFWRSMSWEGEGGWTPQTHPQGCISGVQDGMEGERTHWKPKYTIQGVYGCSRQGKWRIRHHRHAHKGMSLVFKTKGNRGDVPNIQTCPTRDKKRGIGCVRHQTKGKGGTDVPSTQNMVL